MTTTKRLLLEPNCIDVEDSILGNILLFPEKLFEVQSLLLPEMFFSEKNKIIYAKMLEKSELNENIDIITLATELRQIPMAYFADLQSKPIIEVAYGCKVIIEKWMLREIIKNSKKIMDEAVKQESDPFEILSSTQKIFEKIEGYLIQLKPEKNLANEIMPLLEEVDLNFSKKKETGLKSESFPQLNYLTGGIMETDYIIIYGLDKSGKTSFAQRLLLDLALNKKNVGIFTLEMDFKQNAYKMLSMIGELEYLKLRNPVGRKLQIDEFQKFMRKIQVLLNTKIFIDEKTYSFEKIIAKTKLWKKKYNIDIFMYDYIGLMESNVKAESIKYLYKYYSRRLKELAKEIKTPILLLSQANEKGTTADAIDLLRDCDFAIELSKPAEQGIKEITANGNRLQMKDEYFLATIKRSRYGRNNQTFVCGFENENFRQLFDENFNFIENKKYVQEEIF